jgi:hypothetical protein
VAFTTDLADLVDRGLAVEAVVEDPEVKGPSSASSTPCSALLAHTAISIGACSTAGCRRFGGFSAMSGTS